jgi:hypothetical protein
LKARTTAIFFKEGPHVQGCLLVITIETTVDLSGSMLKAEEAIQAAANETGVGNRGQTTIIRLCGSKAAIAK